MDRFTFSYPTKVYFGEGSAKQAFAAELGKVGGTVMLAFGGGSVKKNGVYDEMKALLSQAGKKVVDFSGITPNPTYAKVQEGAALAREKNVDFIIPGGDDCGWAGQTLYLFGWRGNTAVYRRRGVSWFC